MSGLPGDVGAVVLQRNERGAPEGLAVSRQERRRDDRQEARPRHDEGDLREQVVVHRAHHVGELHRPVPSAAATAAGFLMSVPRRCRYAISATTCVSSSPAGPPCCAISWAMRPAWILARSTAPDTSWSV